MRWTEPSLVSRLRAAGRRNCMLISILIGVLINGPALVFAQLITPVNLPDSVVLVLKLISRTQVEATTGVVIHSSGLVLIPAEFATSDDEVVVLDGGTDIVLHGRPATMVQNSLADGLAVLSVPELNRLPLLVSSSDQIASDVLHFATFPPAKTLAERMQTLGLELILETSKLDQALTVSIDTPLPNVAGPLFDRCGLLNGFNLATGTPTLEGPDYPRTLLGQELKEILLGFDIGIDLSACERVESPGLAAETGAEPEKSVDSSVNQLINQMEEEPKSEEEIPKTTQTDLQTQESPLEDQKTQETVSSRNLTVWFVILFALTAISYVGMRRKSANSSLTKTVTHRNTPEPGTEQLLWADKTELLASVFPLQAFEYIPGLPELSEGSEALLCIERTNHEGQTFRSYHDVTDSGLKLLIADEGNTDILINEKELAGPQAGIEVRRNQNEFKLVLSNTSGAGGISIQNVPCLDGDQLYIGPDHVLAVGNFKITFKLIGRPGEAE
jgi:hypothetical protein